MVDGRPLTLDPNAVSASTDMPAFLARPDGAPVYHGFRMLECAPLDGWQFGEITEFMHSEDGDAFVIAPDGSRAGLVWEVGDGEFRQISAPDQGRWGVYAVWFPEPNDSVEALRRNLLSVLPSLTAAHQAVSGDDAGKASE
jgi:hypothetical protein